MTEAGDVPMPMLLAGGLCDACLATRCSFMVLGLLSNASFRKPRHSSRFFSFRLFAGVSQVVLGGVMQAWGVQPNQLSYNTIMDAYARQGNVRNVVKIYNFMQVRSVHRTAPQPTSKRIGFLCISLVAAAS